MKKKIDNKRNSRIVGHNSKSYNDKHPTNPVALRPIHDACMRVPKLFDPKGFAYPDDKTIRKIRAGANYPRMDIAMGIRRIESELARK